MKLLYFAWLRERVGRSEEDIDPPADVATVARLLDWLAGERPELGELLANRRVIRVAVNREHASGETPVAPEDEVALFPPVTGG